MLCTSLVCWRRVRFKITVIHRVGQNHIRCTHGTLGREITRYTVIHGVCINIRFWPILHTVRKADMAIRSREVDKLRTHTMFCGEQPCFCVVNELLTHAMLCGEQPCFCMVNKILTHAMFCGEQPCVCVVNKLLTHAMFCGEQPCFCVVNKLLTHAMFCGEQPCFCVVNSLVLW